MCESPQDPDLTATLEPEYLDELFSIMAHRRRRHILESLEKNDAPISLRELAEEIVAKENESMPSEDAETDVQEVYLSLYHAHIPKLVDADIVEYDEERDVILPSTHTGFAIQYFKTEQ